MGSNLSTINDGGALLSSTFLEFCVKVRNNDPSILPELGKPFRIRPLSEREHMELADALLENTSVTYLQLMDIDTFTKRSAEAIAKYVRTSKRLQRIRWPTNWYRGHRGSVLRHREEMLCCLLPAFQESTSLKELGMELPPIGGPSNLAFEHMLAHTQSLRSLTLIIGEDIAVAAAQSGLKKNITLRELTLECCRGATTVAPILTSLHDHPLLRTLCVRVRGHGYAVDLNGLETVLLSDNSMITELEICKSYGGPPMRGLTHVLQALGCRPTLTKLGLHGCPLDRDEARQLGMVLRETPSLQRLALTDGTLGSAELAELAPESYDNAIKVLDISGNRLGSVDVGVLLETMEHNSNHITDLDLGSNRIGNEGASLLAISLENNALPNFTRLSLHRCGIGDDGFIALMSALEQKKSLLHLDLRQNNGLSERIFLALAVSLPEIKVLQRVDLCWCTGLASAMPLLLAGLRKNTSLFRFHVADCTPFGWMQEMMQEMKSLGYRNHLLYLMRAPKKTLPPRGLWPRALARDGILPDVIFDVLRSQPSLASSGDAMIWK
jgi:hypothetical protein